MAVKEQEVPVLLNTSQPKSAVRTNVVRGVITFYELKPPLDPNLQIVGKIESISDQEIEFLSPKIIKKGARINMHFRITNLTKKERKERESTRPFHAIGRVRSCEWNADINQFLVVVRFTDIFEEDRKFLRKFALTRSQIA